MNSKKRPCSIVRVEHEIIEQQVLMSLSDKAKVALVLDARGLSEIIHAFEDSGFTSDYRTGMLRDLKQLKQAAFGR